MTPEAQRIAIAEACPEVCYQNEAGDWMLRGAINECFDPLTDLNAMRAVEETLTLPEQHAYAELLVQKIRDDEDAAIGERTGRKWHLNGFGYFALLHVAAEQRAEMFLRVKGKLID